MSKWTQMAEEDVAEAVNNRDVRIHRLKRNMGILIAMLRIATNKTEQELRDEVQRREGYGEEI